MSKKPRYSIQGNSIQKIRDNKEKESEGLPEPGYSHIWEVAAGVGVVSAIISGVRGYCDAKGIPLPQGNLEQLLLKFGPIFAGTISGMVTWGEYGVKEAERIPQMVPYPSDIDFILGLFIGGGIGAAAGGIGTLIGYGLGQLAGKLIR